MMLLAIDVGNTNVNFALFEGQKILAQWRAATANKRTSDDWAVWLLAMMQFEGYSSKQVRGCVISCVVPAVLEDLSMMCANYFVPAIVIGQHDLKLDLVVNTDKPSEVGADLIAAAVAAKRYYAYPMLILDLGTAATLSYIDEKGRFSGVAIAPGLHLMQKSLSENAASLPYMVIEKPAKVLGTSTIPCMQSGLFWGYIGLIEGLIARAREEVKNPNLPVLATGGFAREMVEEIPSITNYDQNLTLLGLKAIFEMNNIPCENGNIIKGKFE